MRRDTIRARCSEFLPVRFHYALGLLVFLAATPAFSQSLAEIARQERERKNGQPPQATHVYDNDDLARPQILIPDDRERYRASKPKVSSPPVEPPSDAKGSDEGKNSARSNQAGHNDPFSDPILKSLTPPRERPQILRPGPPHSKPETSFVHGPPMAPLDPPDVRVARGKSAATETPSSGIQTREERRSEGKRSVRVRQGDTLWGLAFEYLGTGNDWLVLAVHNPQVTNPQNLPVGIWIDLPKRAPDPGNPERVAVKPGDSIWKLTHARFGDARGWKCVAQANPQLSDARLIFPGQIINLPQSCSAASLARSHIPELPSDAMPIAQLQPQTH
jgi:nucleoid-associated protein YgaU